MIRGTRDGSPPAFLFPLSYHLSVMDYLLDTGIIV